MEEKSFLTWKKAEQQQGLGNINEAKQLYNTLTTDEQFFSLAHLRHASLCANRPPLNINDLVLVWQTGKHEAGSIVRSLLENIPIKEEVDDSDVNERHQHHYSKFYPNMIVVDHAIRSIESYQYYHKCILSGCNVILIHLADEAFLDLHEIYGFCRLVFRNYWSPVLNRLKDVHFFPLGDNSAKQYPEIDNLRLSSHREYLWNFLGDATKADRQLAIQTFSRIFPHKLHLVTDFFDPRKLGAMEYREILSKSKFTISPDGNLNVDCFRFWEAIEFGSIPLVINRGNFKYFQEITKSELPFPTFKSWEDAAKFAENLKNDDDQMNWLQTSMIKWWQNVKSRLPRDFSHAVNSCRVDHF
jgi:hypothetical protein